MALRKSITVKAVVALLALGVAATGLTLAGCGSSKAAATPTGQASGKPGQGDPTSMVTRQLATLVAKGTITSAQEKAVASAVASSMTSNRPSGGASPAPGVQPQKQGRMFSSALAALVSRGTITSAQKAAIATALSSGMQGGSGQPPSGGQSSAG